MSAFTECRPTMACGSEMSLCDLQGLVSHLRVELAQVKKDLSVVREENSDLKKMIENLCSGGGDGSDSDNGSDNYKSSKWKVVQDKGKGRRTVLAKRRTAGNQHSGGNSFAPLVDECDIEADVISQPPGKSLQIVGDSLCRYLGRAIRGKVSGSYCFPGAGVKRVAEELDDIVDRNSVTCVIAGGNDVHRNRSEELIRQYKEALVKIRNKGGTPVACGILPRLGHGKEWCSRAIGFNCRTEKFCRENNIAFVDVWENFYSRGRLFARDGVHLSRAGVSVLAGLVERAVSGFR